MNSPEEKVTCLASVELGWLPEDCPGPEFNISEIDPNLMSCVSCIARCMDKLRRERQDLQYDPITGLPNRQAFDKTFSRMIERGNNFRLMILDIDGLKRVNDTLGHLQGDDVLRLLAQTVTSQLRPLDQLFRIGGDEFAAILENSGISSDTDEDTFCSRIENSFGQAFQDAEYPSDLKIGVSVGTGVYSGEDGYEFLGSVDEKMYARKESRKQERSTDFVDLREINTQAE